MKSIFFEYSGKLATAFGFLFLIFGATWLILQSLSLELAEVFIRLTVYTFFMMTLMIIPKEFRFFGYGITDKLVFSAKDENDNAINISTSRWAFAGLFESIAYAFILIIINQIFNILSTNVNSAIAPSKIILLFTLIFVLIFGGHFISHIVTTIPLSKKEDIYERIAKETNEIIYPSLYLGGLIGFIYSVIINGSSRLPLLASVFGALVAGILTLVVSLVKWFLEISSTSTTASLNIASAINETEERRVRLFNASHNTILLIGFSFAFWAFYSDSYSITYWMLIMAAVMMVIFNQIPYAIGEHNLRQALLYKSREEMLRLDNEIRSLASQENKDITNRINEAKKRVKDLQDEKSNIEKDHPLFVYNGLLTVGPFGWLIAEIIKQIAK